MRLDGAGDTDAVIDAIQTDAAINPGNSGGAAGRRHRRRDRHQHRDPQPRRRAGREGGSIGLGFAIPIDDARGIAEELIRTGAVSARRPRRQRPLGHATAPPTARRCRTSRRTAPAAAAGIVEGDVIVKVGDRPIGGADELVVAVRAHNPGDVVPVDAGARGPHRSPSPARPSPAGLSARVDVDAGRVRQRRVGGDPRARRGRAVHPRARAAAVRRRVGRAARSGRSASTPPARASSCATSSAPSSTSCASPWRSCAACATSTRARPPPRRSSTTTSPRSSPTASRPARTGAGPDLDEAARREAVAGRRTSAPRSTTTRPEDRPTSSGGRCRCQSVACWNACASASTRPSACRGPTICSPTGSPFTSPHGTLAAGCCVMLNG